MKTFEHEVLFFHAHNEKTHNEMKASLAEWGMAGFAIVAVHPAQDKKGFNGYTVFLSRELIDLKKNHEDAA
ncbi:hypothetical protein [Jannaschia marina]|uniref:hypothetical protein n=1 Tax=Jannaschia marina TaxID=2741674 RepID=UPI0015C6F354|nr:hypothetical protein [Jannaschia marina]